MHNHTIPTVMVIFPYVYFVCSTFCVVCILSAICLVIRITPLLLTWRTIMVYFIHVLLGTLGWKYIYGTV